MNIRIVEKFFRVIFIFVFVAGTVWVPTSHVGASPLAQGDGLHAEYRNLGGTEVILTVNGEGPINHGWNGSCPDTNMYQNECGSWAGMFNSWSLLEETLTGYIEAPATGMYEFHSWIDDYLQITINGVTQTADDIGGAGYSIVMDLVEGQFYPVTMYYKNRGGSADVSLFWTKPDSTFEVVPKQYLYTEIPAQAPVITEGDSVAVIMSVNGTPTPFSLTLHATDGNAGDTLTWSILSQASHGTATASGTGMSIAVEYVPNTDYMGLDSFVVQVSDGNGGTDSIAVKVGVQNAQPGFTAWYQEGFIAGWGGWPIGTGVTLTLDDPNTVQNPDYTSTQYVAPIPWDPGNVEVQFQTASAISITPGFVITMSDGVNTSSTVVSNFTVTTVNIGTDTITGTGRSAANVYGFICNPSFCTNTPGRSVTVDEAGTWSMDFGVSHGPEEEIYDIKLGDHIEFLTNTPEDSGGRIQIRWDVPNPNLHVFVTQDRIEAREWPLGNTVTLTIDRPGTPQTPDYTTTRTIGPAPWNPNENAAEFDLNGVYHYQTGDLITVSDGTLTKTHTVSNVAVTNIDPVAETISGTTDPGAEIRVQIHRENAPYRAVTADGSGNWTVNFATPWNDQGTYDLTPGLNGAAMRYDADGDASRADWNVPNPRFHVQLTQNNVEGYDWPLGTAVTMTIDTDHNGTPEFTSSPQTVVRANWDPNSTVVRFNDVGGIDLAAGMYVTMTNGTITKTHTVTMLALTSVDPATDRVIGTAEPNSYMEVGGLCDENGCAIRRIYADALGNWVADFSIPGAGTDPDEQRLFDIKPGTGNEVRQSDEDSDHTDIDWNIPNPRIMVRANENRIEGQEWTLGSTITVTVDDPGTAPSPDITRTAVVYEASWNPGEYRFNVNLNGVYDIKTGDIVTATDGTTTKTTTVTSLAFTDINFDTNVVTGTAQAGSNVDIWTCDNNNCYNSPTVTADGSGVWSADFTGIFDIVRGTWVDSSQNDEDGDGTFFGKNVPNPRFNVRANDNNIEGQDWALGSTITITVDDPVTPASPDVTRTVVVYAADWNPGEYRFDLNLNGVFDIKTGDIVTATDGTITKTHTVTSLAFTSIDVDTDVITGTAQATSSVDIWTCDDSNCYNYDPDPVADGSGVWTVDFTPIFDIVRGTWIDSSQSDSDGDATSYGQNVPNPRINARLNENAVEAYEFEGNRTVTLQIDNPATPAAVDYTDSQVASYSGSLWNTSLRFDLSGFTLAAGHIVTVSDGITTKMLTVETLEVTGWNVAADTISGIASSQADIWIDAWTDFGAFTRHFQADSGGNWTANYNMVGDENFEQSKLDIVNGISGEVRVDDSDGDSTSVTYMVYTPWVAPNSVPLVVGITRDLDLKHPMYYLEDWSVLNLLYEPFYRVSQADSSLIPAAATGYTISPDSKVFTFTLRSDMLWSDGQPVTAQHYADGLLWLLDPATSPTDSGNPYASLLYDIQGAENFNKGVTTDSNTVGIVALNSTTLQITLSRPAVHLPKILSIPGMIPIRKDIITLYGNAWVEPANFVGNGPFKLLEHDGTHFLFGKNPNYYNASQVDFTQIGMPIIPDTNEQFEAYKRGEVDTIIDAPQSALDDANYNVERVYSAMPGYQTIGLNTKHAPTDNPLVRKALASAIDRRALLDTAMGFPWRQTATGIIPPEFPAYQGNAVGYEYNPTLARDLLAQAGFPGGTGLPTVHLYGNPGNQAQLDFIADQWRTVLGISVETHYLPNFNSWASGCRDDLVNCESNGTRLGWLIDYYDAHNILGDWLSYATSRTGWDNTRYRELLDLIRAEQDPIQRTAYIQEAEQIIVEEDAAVIPLFFYDRVSLVKPGISTVFGSVPYYEQWDNVPVVTSINRLDANPTSAASVRFSVSFSEAVTGVDVSDFSLTATGITGAAITNVTGSLAEYTVTVNTGTGIGTLRLDLIDNDSIIDEDGNPLVGPYSSDGSFTTGQAYSILPSGALPRTETLYFNGLQWDPVICWNPYSYNCNNLMAISQQDNARVTVWETPYVYNMLTGEQFPLLADGPYTWNPARTEITFTIKAAATWSDGTPVTAYDVAYTWATNVKYETNLGMGYQDYIESVEALDPQTVRVKAKLDGEGNTINPLMVTSYLSSNYVIQKAWTQKLEERAGYDPATIRNDSGEDFVASGPYIKFLADNTKVVLMRNEEYWGADVSMWGKLPAPKYLVHVLYADNAAGLNAFKAGQVDINQEFIANVQDLWLVDHLPVSTYYPNAPYHVAGSLPTAYYNLNAYGLDQVAVRKAIAIAVNYEAIIANAMTNQSPTFTQVPRSIMNPSAREQAMYDQAAVAHLQWTGNDITGARALLDAAGIIDTNGDGWREYNGQKLSYVATCPNGWTDWQAAIELVAAVGDDIGIEITTSYPEWSEYQTVVTNSETPFPAGYDIFMMWTTGSVPSSPWARARLLMSSEWNDFSNNWNGNWGGYANPAADALIQAIPGETEPVQLMADYTELTRIYLTDVPSFALMYRPEMFHTVNATVWTNFPHDGDGTNPPVPPLNLTDGYSIAGLYRLVQTDLVPVAVDDIYDAAKNTTLNVTAGSGVLANDTDTDALMAVKVTDPAHGTLTLNTNGSFTYTPNTGYVGNDSFTYQASDGILTSNIATVVIRVGSGAPPTMPSSFYGEIHFSDDAPVVGNIVQAYLPGGTVPAATATISDYQGTLIYGIDVPGETANEGNTVTFKINGRVVAIGVWHSGTNVQLDFHPPQALPGGPYGGDEGAAVDFSASANDAGHDAVSYQWDWNNDGTYDETGQTTAHAFPQDGTYTVGLKVTDTRGGEGTATTTVTVNNVLPVVDAGGPYTGSEGSAVALTGTAPDPGSETLTIEWDFDYNGVTFNVDASGSLSASHTYDNNGTYTVALRVTDDKDSVTDTAEVTVQNIAPTAVLVNNGPVKEGSPATISFSGQADPSGQDTTAGFHYAFACDGGSLASATYANSGTNASTACTFDDGSMITTVRARIIDQDNGFTEYSTDVIVDNVQPTGTFHYPTTVNEGENINLSWTDVFDPSTADTIAGISYAFDCGAGYGEWSTTVTTATCSTTDNGSLTVRGILRDKDLATFEYIVTVTVNDVLPTNVSAGGPYTVVAGQPLTMTASATCASVDACTFAWDLNNDSVYDDATGTTAVHSWNTVGDYTIGVSVTDNDGNAVPASGVVHVTGATHSIALIPGWNLVSFNVHPTDTNIASVLSSVNGNFDLVYAWDATGAHSGSGNWLKADNIEFSPDSLKNLDETMGFWIHMTAADVLEVQGSIPTSTNISLWNNVGGWNLVGYPSAINQNLPAALEAHGVGTDFTLIYAYHASDTSDPWKLFDRTIPPYINDLQYLSPGWGYWIKVNADHTWEVVYIP